MSAAVDLRRVRAQKALSVETCPRCGVFGENTVRDTRLSSEFVLRRRRNCNKCGFSWRTREVLESGTEVNIATLLIEALAYADRMHNVLWQIEAALVGKGD